MPWLKSSRFPNQALYHVILRRWPHNFKKRNVQFSLPNRAMIIKGDFCKKCFFLHFKLTGPDISASTARVKVLEKIENLVGAICKGKFYREIM